MTCSATLRHNAGEALAGLTIGKMFASKGTERSGDAARREAERDGERVRTRKLAQAPAARRGRLAVALAASLAWADALPAPVPPLPLAGRLRSCRLRRRRASATLAPRARCLPCSAGAHAPAAGWPNLGRADVRPRIGGQVAPGDGAAPPPAGARSGRAGQPAGRLRSDRRADAVADAERASSGDGTACHARRSP